ncbi:unnamed protein product, partial [Sphenostylis stenocarpa]
KEKLTLNLNRHATHPLRTYFFNHHGKDHIHDHGDIIVGVVRTNFITSFGGAPSSSTSFEL